MFGKINIMEFTSGYMVLASGRVFPEGLSYRIVPTIDEAVEIRRQIQNGDLRLTPSEFVSTRAEIR
jgi:hypothetical protein